MMETVAAGIIALGIFGVLAGRWGYAPIAMAGLLIVLCFSPNSAAPLLAAFGAAALLSMRRGVFPAAFLPLAALVAAALLTAWPEYEGKTQALLQLVLVISAWMIGKHLVISGATNQSRMMRWVAIAVFVIAVAQFTICALQLAGFSIFTTGERTAELTAGRTNGTTGHPGSLGKVLFFAAMLALPITRSASRVDRRLAYISLGLIVAAVGMTASRTNLIALALMILVWAMLLPAGRAKGARVLLPGGVLAVGLVFLEPILARFEEDPLGGERGRFMEVAIRVIEANPLLGVGPGGYLPYAGNLDALTAQGWRVHNVFMLEVSELGILGGVFLFAPMLWATIIALRNARRDDRAGDYSRALIAGTAGILLMGLTGWGLFQSFIPALWFLAVSFCATAGKLWTLPAEEALASENPASPTSKHWTAHERSIQP